MCSCFTIHLLYSLEKNSGADINPDTELHNLKETECVSLITHLAKLVPCSALLCAFCSLYHNVWLAGTTMSIFSGFSLYSDDVRSSYEPHDMIISCINHEIPDGKETVDTSIYCLSVSYFVERTHLILL